MERSDANALLVSARALVAEAEAAFAGATALLDVSPDKVPCAALSQFLYVARRLCACLGHPYSAHRYDGWMELALTDGRLRDARDYGGYILVALKEYYEAQEREAAR